jgi:hypothetical protein
VIGFPGGYVVFGLTLSSRFYQLVAILWQLPQVFLPLDQFLLPLRRLAASPLCRRCSSIR